MPRTPIHRAAPAAEGCAVGQAASPDPPGAAGVIRDEAV